MFYCLKISTTFQNNKPHRLRDFFEYHHQVLPGVQVQLFPDFMLHVNLLKVDASTWFGVSSQYQIFHCVFYGKPFCQKTR